MVTKIYIKIRGPTKKLHDAHIQTHEHITETRIYELKQFVQQHPASQLYTYETKSYKIESYKRT